MYYQTLVFVSIVSIHRSALVHDVSADTEQIRRPGQDELCPGSVQRHMASGRRGRGHTRSVQEWSKGDYSLKQSDLPTLQFEQGHKLLRVAQTSIEGQNGQEDSCSEAWKGVVSEGWLECN